MFLYRAYQTVFQVTESQQKQMKMFQESQKKESDCTELAWISVVDFM